MGQPIKTRMRRPVAVSPRRRLATSRFAATGAACDFALVGLPSASGQMRFSKRKFAIKPGG
jgi:hypothetical protein